jgi:hypothetical protein
MKSKINILSILIIILFLFYLYLSFIKYKKNSYFEKYKNEKYKNQENCKNTSFCAYDINQNKCVCASQKDDARLQFPNDPNCCETQCNTLPKEKCVQNELNTKYYCNIGGVCKEYNATIQDSVIMANICGIDNVTNQYIMPFMSKEECINKSDPCSKYNNEKLGVSDRERSCLNDTKCGICYNESNVGKCISGTPEGPNDMSTYYFCKPSQRNSDGSNTGIYKYGKKFD